MRYSSILETIGKTPVIKLDDIFDEPLNSKVNLYIKNETVNPGGNHKTRIGFNMVKRAEQEGRLKPGKTILAPTGGNTGIGIAIAGAVLGYRVILVIPNDYSPTKQKILKALGAEIVLSDSRKGGNTHSDLALEMLFENHDHDYVMLNQFGDLANPEMHKQTTAQEILEDFPNDSIDFFVAGIGTGGHITGIGEVLKQKKPEINIIGVQPSGCELLKDQFVPHKIQGLAVGFIPNVLNVNIIDQMVSVSFEESREMMQSLIRKEGLLVGISSGANLAAVSKLIQELQQKKQLNKKINILTMAYDSAIDYLDLLA